MSLKNLADRVIEKHEAAKWKQELNAITKVAINRLIWIAEEFDVSLSEKDISFIKNELLNSSCIDDWEYLYKILSDYYLKNETRH